MVDEKVCNILTETKSSQSYNLCGATPKIMNSIDELLLRPIKEEALEFGLSTLHAYIRFMEWLLHVSYRLDIKVWQETSVLIISFFCRKISRNDSTYQVIFADTRCEEGGSEC